MQVVGGQLPALLPLRCCLLQVRGVTIEGNVTGTTQRTGAHPRYKKSKRR
jgi:hypothetical protein